MSYKTRQEIETEAAHRAREQLDGFPELTQIRSGNREQIEQLESGQRHRAWSRAKLGYTDEAGAQALNDEREKTVKMLYERNVEHLTDTDIHAKTVSDRSWQLVTENFTVFRMPDNKQLSWSQKVESGSPGALEVFKQLYSGIVDDIALTNPSQYLANLFNTYDNEIFRYEYGTDENRKAKVAVFQLKARPKA